jgi:flagellar protein FliJ
MKSLKSLIKIEKWRLEEQRLKLKTLYDQRDELTGLKDTLEQNLEEQKKNYSQNVALGDTTILSISFAGYIQKIMNEYKKLENNINRIDEHIEYQKNVLKDIFQDVKKFEVAEESRIQKQQEILEKQHQKNSDEVALNKSFFKEI